MCVKNKTAVYKAVVRSKEKSVKPIKYILVAVAMIQQQASAQVARRLADSLEYHVEMQATIGSGDHSPLWLNSNRYGLSSVKCNYGYLRGAVQRPVSTDDGQRWALGYAIDAAVTTGLTSRLVLQQAFVEARWLKGTLTVGSKEQPMELKNQQLSSGSQTLGINARPVPQVRLALPEYWTIPYTKGWLALKGHLAYGMFTDDGWQRDFAAPAARRTEHALYHSKAGYLRIGSKAISLEVGMEMASQFGGTTYDYPKPGSVVEHDKGLKAFYHALIPGGTDEGESGTEGAYENADGNHVGSWVARLNVDMPTWYAALYADHFFEDQSGMFLLDYDGYGSGAEWNAKKDSRYFMYDLKDMLVGLELRLKQWPWLNTLLVEYMHTKYQSGPVYHDHAQNISTHISGRDNYYNHSTFTGWQHWGMVAGNPLYMSPLYNDDGIIDVRNNRFTAWHFGVNGQLSARFSYRVLATTQKGYGTYSNLYANPRNNFSMMAEATYQLPNTGWSIRGAAALDSREIYGKNVGFQLTVGKSGFLTSNKRKITK